MANIIRAFCTGVGEFPWRVTVDGKEDPRNRDFEDFNDVKETYTILQEAGYYKGYEIIKGYKTRITNS